METPSADDAVIERGTGLFVAPLTTTYRFYLKSELSRFGLCGLGCGHGVGSGL
jgi:hypothetical protein